MIASDLNDGMPILSYVWTNDDTGAVLGTQPSVLLTPADVYPAQSLSCAVTATDLNGETSSDSLSVGFSCAMCTL